MHVNEGNFDMVIYDIDGNETARRTISIGATTSINDIVSQMTAVVDDNADNNLTNDIDSILNVSFLSNGVLTIELANPSSGYTFALEDQTASGFSTGTNFAGAMGLNRFFDGSDAKDIDLRRDLKIDPSLISAFSAPQDGNNRIAQDMVQLQFEKVKIHNGFNHINDTLYGYFDSVATFVGSHTNTAIVKNDALTAQFNAIELEYASISKVSIDEEMTNLIKYQTAYGAAAKVITTIDQMMDTLLGIKR
jgi:flagellar hook-associated protein 1 FlgK